MERSSILWLGKSTNFRLGHVQVRKVEIGLPEGKWPFVYCLNIWLNKLNHDILFKLHMVKSSGVTKLTIIRCFSQMFLCNGDATSGFYIKSPLHHHLWWNSGVPKAFGAGSGGGSGAVQPDVLATQCGVEATEGLGECDVAKGWWFGPKRMVWPMKNGGFRQL